MPKPLLIEIGCEEIPARMVESLARQFADRLNQHLSDAGLVSAPVSAAHWTPRRLIYLHDAVLEIQPSREEEILGPPVRVAVAAGGGYTPQATGFAAKNDAQAADLFRLVTPKGEYIALRKKAGGKDALSLLSAIIPRAFHELDLPRSMRWESGVALRFVRPVRWLLALLGADPIQFQLGNLRSGTISRGHRALGAAAFPVATVADYPARWLENFVIADPAQRRAQIEAAIGQVKANPALLDALVNLTEYPDAVRGDFDPAYLTSLPSEVLVTVMRDHQKYFAVEDPPGRLAPHFVAVINQKGDPQGLIRHGNERVLRARFSDARFFWEQDRKLSLGERLPLLEQVTFQVKLGSYRDKSLRMRSLAAWLAQQWPGADPELAAIAAELAKCDLTSDMVKEFPELQGIMGGHYARAEGRSEAIAQAIADQYVWDVPPRTIEGAAVSLADKLDTIVGMFAIGEIPTGSADPFALRRQANGVIRTLIEWRQLEDALSAGGHPLPPIEARTPSDQRERPKQKVASHMRLPLSLSAAFDQALRGYQRDAGRAELAAFFSERLSFYLTEKGWARPLVAAVLAAGADQPLDAESRVHALAAAPEKAAVAAVVKRARNIVRKEKWTAADVNPALLAAPAEVALHQAVDSLPAGADYAAELTAIGQLAAPLERFFAEVRVNDDLPAVRANRLSLLAWAVARLSRIADFSELVGNQ